MIQSTKDWIRVEQIKDHSEKKMYKAKRQGIIKEVRPLLSEMRQNSFYVSSVVEQMVLEQAAE